MWAARTRPSLRVIRLATGVISDRWLDSQRPEHNKIYTVIRGFGVTEGEDVPTEGMASAEAGAMAKTIAKRARSESLNIKFFIVVYFKWVNPSRADICILLQ